MPTVSAEAATAASPLAVKLGPLELRSPLIMASGTWGYGTEGAGYLGSTPIGAIALKGVTRQPRAGNPPPRLHEIPAGMMNSVGLENVGIEALLRDKLPAVRDLPCKRLVNFAGGDVAEYGEMAGMLADADGVDALEANVSCPNVKAGGKAFGTDACAVEEIARAVRANAPRLPLFLKLSPSVTDIVPIAEAAMRGGADGLTIANCYLGLAVDVHHRRAVFANVVGGVSGPAIRVLTLRLVWQVAKAMPGVPIIGLGGVSKAEDAVEYLLAGATGVGVGAASLQHPDAARRIHRGLGEYLQRHGLASVRELIGAL